MMNKLQSAKLHLVKFLFVLPLLAVLLLAFRGRWKEQGKDNNTDRKVSIAGLVVDAATRKPLADVTIYSKQNNIRVQTDDKGYYLLQIPYENKPLQFSLMVFKKGYAAIHQQENWGNFYEEHIRDLYGNTFEFFGLGREGRTDEGFSALAGKNVDVADLNYEGALKHLKEVLNNQQNYSDTIPGINVPNAKGYFINVKDRTGNCTIMIKDKNGKVIESLLLTKWNENKSYYEDKYGKIPPPPPAEEFNPGLNAFLERNPDVKSVGWVFNNVGENLVVEAQIHKKDGSVEKYNLKDDADKSKLEKKYG
ncbi:MAG: carboxypeptidase-like regulatory domain-containing protein, partial [Methylotenera sp.]